MMLPLKGDVLVHSHKLILIEKIINDCEKTCSSLPDTGSRVVNTTEQSAVSQLRQGIAGVCRVPLEGVLVVVQGLGPGHSQQASQPDLQ